MLWRKEAKRISLSAFHVGDIHFLIFLWECVMIQHNKKFIYLSFWHTLLENLFGNRYLFVETVNLQFPIFIDSWCRCNTVSKRLGWIISQSTQLRRTIQWRYWSRMRYKKGTSKWRQGYFVSFLLGKCVICTGNCNVNGYRLVFTIDGIICG